MVQAGSSLLRRTSSTGHPEELQDRQPDRVQNIVSNGLQGGLYEPVFIHQAIAGPSDLDRNNDSLHKAKHSLQLSSNSPSSSFTSSPLTQRPLSPAATDESDSSASTATAIDIPTRRGAHLPVNYPGSSLGSYLQQSPRSFVSSHRRRVSSSLAAFADTIHESSSEDEQLNHEGYSIHAQDPSHYDQSSTSRVTYSTSSPRYPSGLGIHLTGSQSAARRSSPSSTSTSPMQMLPPSPSSYSPSAMKTLRRQSSGNHSPLALNALSTSPASPGRSLLSSSFVGSYEQSLLSGRMANKASNAATPLPFTASVGVLGLGKNVPRALKCPDHVTIPFGAYFWDMDSQDKKGKGSPYVGTLEITEHYMSLLDKTSNGEKSSTLSFEPQESFTKSEPSAVPRFPGYRIPPKGQIQVVIKNANQTAVKLFLVPYDLSDMPPGSKTFIRQKSYDIDPSSPALSSERSTSHIAESPSSTSLRAKETLRYAVHLHFCSMPAKERERGRKKSPSAARRAPGLHHGHQMPHSYHQAQRPPSLPRRAQAGEDAERPASPHAQLRRPRSNTSTASHIYLYKSIRVAFTSRALDLSEKLKTVHEGPSGLQSAPSSKEQLAANTDGPVDKDKYSSYTGPGEEWEEARRKRIEADKAHERHVAQLQKLQLRLEDPIPFDPNGEFNTPSDVSGRVKLGLAPEISNTRASGYTLLNTPPVEATRMSLDSTASGRGRSATLGSNMLMYPPDVPEPLLFQRSPVMRNAPLPSLLESGLSISRPGSRSRNHTTSPDKVNFGNLSPTKEPLR